MQIEEMIPHILTLFGSLLTAYGTTQRMLGSLQSEVKANKQWILTLSSEQREFKLLSEKLAVAINDVRHLDGRLGRMERRIERLHQIAGEGDDAL